MGKFIHPFTDAGFKRIFGQEEHKDLLIAFLNRLFEGEMKITDVQYLDKENPPEHENGKNFIYDIYCTINTGEHIIVEMQNKQMQNFLQRSMSYAARAIDRQSTQGKNWKYKDLKAVYAISFLNFSMEELPPNLLVDGQIIDNYTGQKINPFMRLIYIQLPYMTKKLDECANDFERWIYLLKNIEDMDSIPSHLRSTLNELDRFETIMKEASLNDKERRQYERSLQYYRDEMDTIAFYKTEGLEEGRAEGRAEGRDEERIKIAKNLKAMGLSFGDIAKASGLSAEEVAAL